MWEFWWGFHRDRFLHRWEGMFIEGCFGPGRWEMSESVPTQDDREAVRGALHALLRGDTTLDPQLRAASLIALAKVSGNRHPDALKTLLAHVEHEQAVVAEASVMALGILADEGAIPYLLELLQGEGSHRRRAFAAYSLGLLGWMSIDDAPRRAIAEALLDVLEDEATPRVIAIAAIQAFGLCGVHQGEAILGDGADIPGNGRHVLSREAQVRYLLEYVRPASNRHFLVTAHAPAAIATLLEAGDGVGARMRVAAAEALLDLTTASSQARREVQWGAVQALGRIGTADHAGAAPGVDDRIRASLLQVAEHGDPMGRRFALLALAETAGRTPGVGGTATSKVASFLRKQLEDGDPGIRPWAGLAAGFLCAQLEDEVGAIRAGLLASLRQAAADCDDPRDIGAHLLALGLCRDGDAVEVAMSRLRRFDGDIDAQGYCVLALGLMGDRSPLPELMRVNAQVAGRYEFVRQAAIGIALLHADPAPLLAMLEDVQNPRSKAAVAYALGLSGKRQAVEPLLRWVQDAEAPASTRACAVAALGNLCGHFPVSWNASYAVGLNYRAIPSTLTDPSAHGLLDIL